MANCPPADASIPRNLIFRKSIGSFTAHLSARKKKSRDAACCAYCLGFFQKQETALAVRYGQPSNGLQRAFEEAFRGLQKKIDHEVADAEIFF
jgi:hypothetical protein